jgi:O-antigen ligase
MGILIAFLCGYNIKDTFSYVYLKKIAFLLVIIYLILLVDFFYNVVIIRDLLELFYVSSFHRFYGTYGNVNYLWIISSFIVLSMLISYFVQNKKFSLKQLIYITLTLVVCALSVIMSGSNTNVLIFVLLFVIYFLLTLIVQFKIKNFILIAFLCSIICITFYNILINIEFLPIFTHRAEAIKSILLGNIYIIIEELSSRVNTWNNALPEIFDRFIIGHGSMKSGITILDNSYLMTLYRYGIVGLILELLLYLFAFIYLFNMFLKSKKYKEFYIYLLPLLLLLGYVISCIPANSFYELRLPYLLFFVLGYFNKQIQFA